ncbi:hypothetical protein LWI28_000904 [Acer negundo]|uniref:NB-ARC domain-containing protein n=1 Tax=Acer negundo TaxID=4023 RepID=A0AAD5JPN3_ACENE|nr:hypothetical protein LWI28_000904 [Acer negundo]
MQETLLMEFVGPIVDILKCIGPPLCKYIEYHRKLEEYKKNLIKMVDELEGLKDEIERRLKAEGGFGKLPKIEVKSWLENVQTIIHEAKNIEDTFEKVKYLSRVNQAKRVVKKIQEVKEYHQKGNSFNSLVIDAPPAVGITLPTTRLAGETTAKKNMEEIWRHLIANEIKKIGVWGIGGAGKTTIVTHIHNRLIEENKFNHVIWVTISQTLDLIKVQNGIANALKQSLSGIEDQKIRAGTLLNHDIPTNDLVDCWIAEELVDEMVNLQATEDRARIIIKSLVSNCLLLESTDWKRRSHVKLHDVVRDMTIRYITSKSPLFMVKAGLKLEELPSGKEWKENLEKVSLMDNLIREIPSSLSPNCQILSTLLLQGNHLESISESFFTHMHGLKILNLSETQIESLPNSISELTNLTALLLKNCGRLKRVPSLARLRALAKLELGYTAINEVPTGMEMLANLTSLDLLCSELHMIPAGIFSKLCRLQKLRVNWGLETLKVAVEEAATLKKLDRLLAQFHNLQDFNCFMKSLNSHGILSEYCLLLCPNGIVDVYQLDLDYLRCTLRYDVNKAVILDGCNIRGREEEDSIVLPKQVEFLRIRDCHDVRNMSNIPTFNTLERLETLEVVNCAEMEELIAVDDDDDDNEERKLKRLSLSSMPKLKKIISSSSSKLQLGVLKNLEEIEVVDCGEMEEIIAIDDVDCKKELMISLPKLRKLTLEDMLELKSIINVCGGSNGVLMVCDSLQVIYIRRCWKLKKILSSSSSKLQLGVLKNLEEINVGFCGKMEEIIAIDDVDCKKELMISLPKLRKMALSGMRELKSIINVCGGSNGVLMVCDSLQVIDIWWCPQLKRFPIYLPIDEKGEPSPPPALNEIYVQRSWWEALEWDHLHPNAKTLLLPFCRFYY